jgi:2-polyprenyl-3-methyl-5-hydroxy-6-metoxy-1,4-benzoquinol methylase
LSGIPITQTLFESFNPKKRYDCILALHVLEHVDEPVKLLRQMRSWLSDAGSIVIIVPNKNSLHRQLAVNMGLQKELDDFSARDVAVGHQRVYCHDSLQHDVEAAGFEVSVKTGFFLKTLPNSMMLDHSEALIHALNDISPHIPVELLANIGMVIK